MIKEIKLKKYKGITEATLSDLGHINIICGKNNSGKSSVLEAIMLEKNRSLGRKIFENDIKWFIDRFESIADGYNMPSSSVLKKWFQDFIPSQKGVTIYDSSIEQCVEDCTKNFNAYSGKKYDKLNFNPLFVDFLSEQNSNFNPILIPPKRRLESETAINTNATPSPLGENLLNRLFFLKNQDPHSQESKIYQEIYDRFKEITDGYYFNIVIVPTENNKISLLFTNNLSSWIKADACGLGLREVLTIISFIIDFNYNFILIEEPENHIHPDMQRKLVSFIKSREEQQFVLATHSNIFLDPAFTDRVYRTLMKDNVEISDDTGKAKILSDLGYTVVDNLVSDLIVLTEGPKDTPVIQEFCVKMGLDKKFIIRAWPLGGDIMDQVDLSVMIENRNAIALIDSDFKSSKVRRRFKEKCAEFNIECVKLKRYAIENYFPISAIKKVFPNKVPDNITTLDPKIKVKDQLGFNVKNQAREIIRQSDLNDFKGTDLLEFFYKLKAKLENT